MSREGAVWATTREGGGGVANNKSADQPAQLRSLIHCYSLYIGQYHIKTCSIHNSMFQMVSIAEETGLSLALSDTPKTGFVEAQI